MAGPSYLPEAVPTELGWAHPLTGEQLDVTKGLEDAVDYYKPNAGALSFIDPEGETEFLGFAVVTGRRVRLAVHTLHPIVSVEWDFGDDSDPVVGGYRASHVYPADPSSETYTATATVTYIAEDPNGEEGDTIELDEEVMIEVVVPSSLPGVAPVNTVAPAITGTETVGETLTVSTGTWTGDPTPTFAVQWQSAEAEDGEFTNIAGATAATLDLAAEHESLFIRARVTATNTGGVVTATSAVVGPVAAAG